MHNPQGLSESDAMANMMNNRAERGVEPTKPIIDQDVRGFTDTQLLDDHGWNARQVVEARLDQGFHIDDDGVAQNFENRTQVLVEDDIRQRKQDWADRKGTPEELNSIERYENELYKQAERVDVEGQNKTLADARKGNTVRNIGRDSTSKLAAMIREKMAQEAVDRAAGETGKFLDTGVEFTDDRNCQGC